MQNENNDEQSRGLALEGNMQSGKPGALRILDTLNTWVLLALG